MIKRNKMIVSLALMLALLTALTACSGKENKAEEGATDQAATNNASKEENAFVFGETPLSFSFYGNYDWYTMYPWGEDMATKWIQDNKQVTVKAIPSSGAASQKFTTMLASKKLPDVVWLDRGPDVEKLVKAGLVVPLDSYLEKYPNLVKYAGEETLNMLRSSDGKLYQFPNWYTNRPMGNGGYAVNIEIYKALGEPRLETFDDLYAYLKLVKEKYPDVIPYETGMTGQGMDMFYPGMADDHPMQNLAMRAVPQGDKLISLFTDPVYRETMKYTSKLFREKLITQDALTQTRDQVKEKVNNGKVAVYSAYDTTGLLPTADGILKEKNPNGGYQIIWPVHKEGVDPNKVWVNQYDSIGWNVSLITTSAKNPEGIFAYLDWLTSPEGERVIFWGPEGHYWEGTDENGAPLYTDKFIEEKDERTKNMAIWDTFQWAGNTSFIDTSKAVNEMKLAEDKRSWDTVAQTSVTWKTSFNATQFAGIEPIQESDEGVIAQQIGQIADQARAKVMFAKSDEEVDSILDKAEKDAQAAGYEKLLAYKTQIWQQNLKKMQGN
ncbi:extracellular solute-binding protein [Paenibacillus sp. YIM B09110]|uniref:extracellular solute-binding protein n=1 Tax=Paenibacillus sp. YIM B09110 TaxID=3126102 RepID=UPI00301C76F0